MTTATMQLDCGHAPSEHGPCDTGYGTDAAGRTLCYECCTSQDREALRTADRFCGYISADGRNLTNWPGRWLGSVVRWGAVHPWARPTIAGGRRRSYVRVKDAFGGNWYGTGAPGEYCNLKRARG